VEGDVTLPPLETETVRLALAKVEQHCCELCGAWAAIDADALADVGIAMCEACLAAEIEYALSEGFDDFTEAARDGGSGHRPPRAA